MMEHREETELWVSSIFVLGFLVGCCVHFGIASVFVEDQFERLIFSY